MDFLATPMRWTLQKWYVPAGVAICSTLIFLIIMLLRGVDVMGLLTTAVLTTLLFGLGYCSCFIYTLARRKEMLKGGPLIFWKLVGLLCFYLFFLTAITCLFGTLWNVVLGSNVDLIRFNAATFSIGMMFGLSFGYRECLQASGGSWEQTPPVEAQTETPAGSDAPGNATDCSSPTQTH